MAKSAAAVRLCETCACFVARAFQGEKARAAAEHAGVDPDTGECRRYPRYEKRRRDDWCGEHRQRQEKKP